MGYRITLYAHPPHNTTPTFRTLSNAYTLLDHRSGLEKRGRGEERRGEVEREDLAQLIYFIANFSQFPQFIFNQASKHHYHFVNNNKAMPPKPQPRSQDIKIPQPKKQDPKQALPQSKPDPPKSPRSPKSPKSPRKPQAEGEEEGNDEAARKNKQAEMFKKYLDQTGIAMAFQVIFAQILDKRIEEPKLFSYTAMRLRQIGQDLEKIKITKK